MDIIDQSDKNNNKLYITFFPLYIRGNKKFIEDSKEIICLKVQGNAEYKLKIIMLNYLNAKIII
jgi:hypothetical protein